VLLNPNGSGGDVYPFLAIGQQLQRLGHHVGVMLPHGTGVNLAAEQIDLVFRQRFQKS
jgi:UDP:flavonoid glycosyltransferase YjiC (YdhE family)